MGGEWNKVAFSASSPLIGGAQGPPCVSACCHSCRHGFRSSPPCHHSEHSGRIQFQGWPEQAGTPSPCWPLAAPPWPYVYGTPAGASCHALLPWCKELPPLTHTPLNISKPGVGLQLPRWPHQGSTAPPCCHPATPPAGGRRPQLEHAHRSCSRGLRSFPLRHTFSRSTQH